jgi:HD-like signal output (HDOD) protein/CheY-like chemotaxis protein
MKKRILFVDDEPNILNGLKRMMREKRNIWDSEFADGGEKALELLSQSHFDIIISDMRMPNMTGVELLTQVKKLYPNIIRIILSGHADEESSLKAISVTHQFIAKPCDANQLQRIIHRALELKSLLQNDNLIGKIAKLDTLPSLPKVYQEISNLMSKPYSSIEDVALVIEKDVAITSKLLHIVNSSFFGLAKKITSVSTAINSLGLSMLKNLTLLCSATTASNPFDNIKGFSFDKLQSDSILYGCLTRDIYNTVDKEKSDDAFMAGFLYGIGYLVMAQCQASKFQEAIDKSNNENLPLVDCELDVFGCTHGEIGAYLLGIWGLPLPIIEAVAYYLNPKQIKNEEFNLVYALYFANIIIKEARGELNEDYIAILKKLGVDSHLPKWRESAQKLLSQ